MKLNLMMVEGEGYLSVEINNTNAKYFILNNMQEFTLQRMYYRSKTDYNYIEYIEPKIFDAFICCMDFIGDPIAMKNKIFEIKNKFETMEHLEKCAYTPMEETEIKKLASLMIKEKLH